MRSGDEFRDVALVYFMLLELLLQDGQVVRPFCKDYDAGSVHVQAVAGADVRAGAAALKALLKGDLQRTPRHCKHPRRLVGHYDAVVLIQNTVVLSTGRGVLLQGIWLNIEPLQHEGEQRAAFARAGRIEASLMPDFFLWGGAVPEFAHCQRFEAMEIGVLQELGRGAVPSPSGRDEAALGKDFQYALPLSKCIQHDILIEQPLLKGC